MKIQKIVFLVIVICAITTVSAQKSRKSVEKFLVAVSTIENVSEEDYTKRLRPLIDPETNVDSLCADFYMNWKYNLLANNKQLSYSIESLTEENGTATVVVTSIWLMADNVKYQFKTKATWVLKKKKWYRSGEISTRVSSTKIE